MSEKLRQQIYFWSLIYLALSLPGQFLWFPPTLGILTLGLGWLLSFRFKEKWQLLKTNRALHLVLLLFLAALAGMIYTQNTSAGWKDVTVKMALFAFPVGLSSVREISKAQRNKVLLAFAYTTSAASLFLLVSAFLYFQKSGEEAALTYHDLLHFKRVPIHYFTLYASFSVFVLLEKILTKSRKSFWLKILSAICILLLISVILKSGVRIQLLAFPIALLAFLLIKIKRKRTAVGIFAGAVALFLLLAWLTPSLRSRLTDTANEFQALRGKTEIYQTNHRVFLWTDGWKVIKENFWIGTGTGSANDFLYEKVKTRDAKFWRGEDFYFLSAKKYNFHNEFLQHWASAGIVGFLILLLVFSLGIYWAFHRNQPIALVFLALCAVAFLTESMLERQAGNLFFGFFLALLIVSPHGSKNLSEKD